MKELRYERETSLQTEIAGVRLGKKKIQRNLKNLNAKRFLKYISKTFKKLNDVSALRNAIIKRKSEKV